MIRRTLLRLAAWAVALTLAAAVSPVLAGDDGCRPYPVTDYSPTGVVGCVVYGEGTASMWGGPGAARNDCVYPWTDCQTISIQSLQTGLVIIVTPTMYGDLYLGDDDPSNDRIVDLDPGMVAALGLDAAAGLWRVNVTPVDARSGQPLLPDTSMERP
jgi:hypothetical protein